MLSEEEKKAIEKLKKIREDTIKANECGLSNNDFKEEIEVYNTVLNIITKLQKENEEKDKQIKTLNHTNKTYKGMLNKQNKQIDLMLDKIDMTKPSPCTMTNEYSIGRVYMSKEEKRQYFETKAKKGE